MNILALETSMGACGVAVLKIASGDRSVVTREERMTKGHAEALMPMLAAGMQEAGLDFSQLHLVAATLGPGSFTGVRIAIAAARALALVTPAKLWGTDSLSVMARSVLSTGALSGHATPFVVAIDARAGQLYFGLFEADGRKRMGPLLLSHEAAAEHLPAQTSLAVGSGAAALADAASRNGLRIEARLPDFQPNAVALVELAAEADETLPTLRPLYLRAPDAKPQTGAVARQ
jgi:tRNA threonylcarbamoyladenosine biosynthesis protein TsaB